MPKPDLLNEPFPLEWTSTRHCPTCGRVDFKVFSDPVELGEWCTTECKWCGRALRHDYIDGRESWEDPEWTGEH